MSPAPIPAAPPPQADHEVEIARLFAAKDSADWRLPMQLAHALPFAAFAASVERPPHQPPVLMVEAVLPCPEATEAEAGRFRLRSRTIPRFVIAVSESQWCSACAYAGLFGVPITPVQALALLVGERLAIIDEPPGPGRPFIGKWTEAVVALARATCDMHWQALALTTDRTAVHKASRSIKDDVRHLQSGWGTTGRTGITP